MLEGAKCVSRRGEARTEKGGRNVNELSSGKTIGDTLQICARHACAFKRCQLVRQSVLEKTRQKSAEANFSFGRSATPREKSGVEVPEAWGMVMWLFAGGFECSSEKKEQIDE